MSEELREPTADRKPVVFVKDGGIFASSRDVAEFFEKEHKNVLRDIDTLISNAPECQLNFEPVKYVDAKGESRRCFSMTRDGFTLLAMGFTGTKAIQWKLRYMEAFNAMEAQLTESAFKIPKTFLEALELAVAQEQKLVAVRAENEAAREEIECMRPAVAALDRLAGIDGSFCVRDASHQLQVEERKFINWLIQNGWMYRRAGTPGLFGYAGRFKSGYLEAKEIEYKSSTGEMKVKMQVRITSAGMATLAKIFEGDRSGKGLPPVKLFPERE